MNVYEELRTVCVVICEECGEESETCWTKYGAAHYAVEHGWQEVIVEGQKETVCPSCYRSLSGIIEQTLVPTLG